jgi:hypothetical protein
MQQLHRALHAALATSALAMALSVHAADANITFNGASLISLVTPCSTLNSPPPGYRTWTSANGVNVTYTYDTSCTYLEIEVNNTTNDVQNYAMVSNPLQVLQPGDYVRVLGNIEVEDAQPSTIIGVGIEADNGAGSSQLVDGPLSVIEQSLKTPQNATTYYAAGTVSDRHGVALNNVQPRLKVYNIPSGTKIKIKVRSLSMQLTKLSGIWIRPLDTTQSVLRPLEPAQIMLPSKPFKLTAELIAQTPLTGYQSHLRLELATNANTSVSYGPRAVAAGLSADLGAGALRDSWSTSNAPGGTGTYNVYYRLIAQGTTTGVKLNRTDLSVGESPAPGGGMQYKIGQIKVDWDAPMTIGNAFHSIHPGYSAPVGHDIVRSLSHAKTSLKNWWRIDPATGQPVMAWEEKPANTNFGDWVTGVSGYLRKAVITFYGMRTEIAEDKTVRGVWGGSVDGGFISAPTKPGLAAYATVVRKTVTKFQSSIYAVECWNEPDSTGHFVGSRTQLADLCQTIHKETKAIDTNNKIKILCPQASSPTTIGWVLGARTSDGHAITEYCDTVGAHLYGYTGDDATGKAYSLGSLSNAIKDMKNRIAKFPEAADKALAVTEFGTHQCLWNGGFTTKYPESRVATDNALKGDIVYNSLLTLKEQNIRVVALYSYDTSRLEYLGTCPIYGGYSWQYFAPTDTTPGSDNKPVLDRITGAVNTL